MMRLLIALVLTLPCRAQTPRFWKVFEPRPQTYVGTRDSGYAGRFSASLRSTDQASAKTYGLYVQEIQADHFRGGRLRLSGFLRSQLEREAWCGLWVRVEGRKGPPLAFENMGQRPVTRHTPWTSYQIEVDVPPQAESIHFGALLTGQGQIWVDDLRLELVGKPAPGQLELRKLRNLPVDPSNLGFEE